MNILIATDPATGGNFLSWSLYYLSGRVKYHYQTTNQWHDVPENPLTKINSHKFNVDHPWAIEEFDHLLPSLKPSSDDGIDCVYINGFKNASTDQINLIMDQLKNWADRIVVLTLPPEHKLYHCKYQQRVLAPKLSNYKIKNKTWEEQHHEFIEYFFKSADTAWKSLNLPDVWDHREFLALNFRPLDHSKIDLSLLSDQNDYFYMDCRDIWTLFDFSIHDIFDYLGLPLEQQRFDHWCSVYHEWRGFHQDRVKFGWYFDEIISNILSGRYMDLKRFDLDIVREAAIQHVMIYEHGLNFKTWGLTKFENTQQLHDLLEPNIHDIVPYDIKSFR